MPRRKKKKQLEEATLLEKTVNLHREREMRRGYAIGASKISKAQRRANTARVRRRIAAGKRARKGARNKK